MSKKTDRNIRHRTDIVMRLGKRSLDIQTETLPFTRLTNGVSKKIENHAAAVELHFIHYNFARIHNSLRIAPAMAASPERSCVEFGRNRDNGRCEMNRWNIPALLEQEIVHRDKACVYCGVTFGLTVGRGNRPSWEHIINDAKLISRDNIARCCCSCNSSKGVKPLIVWLESVYCKKRGISVATVADVVKRAIANATNSN